MSVKLSAVVFTFWPEEEHYLEACLKSVHFADEVIVVDNGATEKTLEIARKYTKKIYRTASKDFSEMHNLGKEKATSDWVLFIDADERVSLALQKEILKELESPRSDAYELRRVNFFLGKEVKFGDRYPDYVTRLFKKDRLEGWTGVIHESSKVSGEIGKLEAPLYHLTHRDIFSMMEKTINFSEREARLRLAANHPKVVGWRLVRVFLTEFYSRLVKYQGWRQGTEGWIDGIFQSFSLFIVYAKLWEMQRKPSLKDTYEELDRKILEGTL
ncbi:glycosyltransferase family 2 protein [Patescibacteria group bacterium]|nr:glycosyltransferase family 2 protein [Patescibacteria group bacterium]